MVLDVGCVELGIVVCVEGFGFFVVGVGGIGDLVRSLGLGDVFRM